MFIWKLKLGIYLLFGAFYLVLLSSTASAGIIIKSPAYLGLSNGLVGHWTFDGADISGTRAKDRSGNNNHGTLTNGPVPTLGKIGQALNFDGTNDNVNIFPTSSTLDNLGPMSISFWIRPDRVNNTSTIIHKGDGYPMIDGWILRKVSARLHFSIDTSGTEPNYNSGSSALVAKEWQHVVFTWDGNVTSNKANFYINGIIDNGTLTAGTGSRNSDASSNFMNIGGNVSGWYVDGQMDDVRIYNRALSAEEIKQLYDMGI